MLPEEQVTFIYLNLDTRLEDFKFWMAHELAHVYTPDLAGTEFGEDYATLLLELCCSQKKWQESPTLKRQMRKATVSKWKSYAGTRRLSKISLFSVFCEARNYAKASGLQQLRVSDTDIHMVRNSSGVRL